MDLFPFNFDLPPNLIAQNPASPRDACRLMVLNRQQQSITHDVFFHLPGLLNRGDVLVLNKTKVIPARLRCVIDGKASELFLTRPLPRTTDRGSGGEEWLALVHPGKRFKIGSCIQLSPKVSVEVLGQSSHGQRVIRFNVEGENLLEFLKETGEAPLPPYLENSQASLDDYQTVFAKKEGSVAAPTASLHFTKELFDRLENKGIHIEFVTLHVGIGTFLPIRTNNIKEHVMHKEEYELDFACAERLTVAKHQGRRLIAVGTTTVRVLESTWKKEGFYAGRGETSLYIYPGYKWKAVDGLITNFHLPKSTLLLLTCAFGGYDLVMKAYLEAINKKYRFYSFGDAMLIL